MTLKDLIKDNLVKFDSFRQGFFYYNVTYREPDLIDPAGTIPDMYQFPVPIEDVGNATLLSKDKAITYMRWIRKAKEEGTLIKL